MADPQIHARAIHREACFVAPSPELAERWKADLAGLRGGGVGSDIASVLAIARQPRPLGFDDGVILPPEEYPVDTPLTAIRNAAADRAPLRGTVRVIVVLVDFSDKKMTATTDHFRDLFFSTGVLPHGSVREYYREVTNNLVDLDGEVVGPFRMPQTLAWYANGNFGIGRPTGTTRARDMAMDAFLAANPSVNFGPYDNDGNGYVDAFIVIHAGTGGEASGNSGDIWSHKWTLTSQQNADGTKVYGYLTIPEDAKIGVSAHELGHLLFGFPDLYDTDNTSEGIGNWCLMAAGSWGGGGDVPVHPSAWCKANQGWAAVTNVTANGPATIPDVKASHTVHRLWKDGAAGQEYFLVENRQQTGYDVSLPAGGLLIWHIDDAQTSNTDENHYKVALMQADGRRDLELNHNRGDAGDPYPGSAANTSFSSSSTPSSHSYAGADTCVSVTGISAAGASMTAQLTVSCGKSVVKDAKDHKDGVKEAKEPVKERKDIKDHKDGIKDRKDGKDGKEPVKERKDIKDHKDGVKDVKEPFKERKDIKDHTEGKGPLADRPPLPPGPGPLAAYADQGGDMMSLLAELTERVALLEQLTQGSPGGAEPFIGSELRPDLIGGPTYGSDRSSGPGDRSVKQNLDSPPR
jgi:immune inhibitor A